MNHLIFALLLISLTLSQPPGAGIGGGIQLIPADTTSGAGMPGDGSSAPPSGSLAMDTSSSDSANVGKSSPNLAPAPDSAENRIPSDPFGPIFPTFPPIARCNTCKFCGLAIKIYGTNKYLTKVNSWFQFMTSTNPSSSQIFTLNQNSDCTWSISIGGYYLSLTSGGNWVFTSATSGFYERWYIERSGPSVFLESVTFQYNYWRASTAPWYYLGTSYAVGTRLTFEYYPCDKTFGWNW